MWSAHSSFYNLTLFPNSIKKWGRSSPPVEGDREFCLGDFFNWDGNWTRSSFDHSTILQCQKQDYWISINQMTMTYVYIKTCLGLAIFLGKWKFLFGEGIKIQWEGSLLGGLALTWGLKLTQGKIWINKKRGRSKTCWIFSQN